MEIIFAVESHSSKKKRIVNDKLLYAGFVINPSMSIQI